MIYGYAGQMPLQLKIGLLLIILAAIGLCAELARSACDDFIAQSTFYLLIAGLAIIATYMLIFA